MNLIGINGYIGVGKDTVGQIIQYLTTNKKDISYSGSYNSYVMDLGMGSPVKSIWQIKKFAYKLKQIASILTGIPAEDFEDQEFKKTNLGKEWNIPRERWTYPGGKPLITIEDSIYTVREFLQLLGTEAIRNNIHTNALVNALFADYKPASTKITDMYMTNEDFINDEVTIEGEIIYPNWIITDVRFPNEAQAIKDREGIVVRVNRIPHIERRNIVIRHSSETSLDNWEFDYTIDNNGSVEELIDKVRKMLIHFNIIS